MRVVTFTSAEGGSGGARQAAYQTEGLRALGHEAFFCLPECSSLWHSGEPKEHWLSLPAEEARWKGVLESLFAFVSTSSGTSSHTIIHAFHNRAVKLAAWWGLGWMRQGVACVAHRGIITRPKNPLPYWSPGIRLFLPNSEACARSLGWYCPRRKIRVVPNGVPDSRITPIRPADDVRAELDLRPDDIVLGYIGNDSPAKGTDVLIKAFGRACGRDSADKGMERARLVLMGVSPGLWTPLAEAEGVADRVRAIPPRRYVSDILQICSAFVFPSRGMDSAPNVLLEAVRMGLPVVSTDVGGCPDIVDGNGLLVPAGLVDPLAEALAVMCRDAAHRKVWAEQSLRVGARYTVEARCRILENVYSGLF